MTVGETIAFGIHNCVQDLAQALEGSRHRETRAGGLNRKSAILKPSELSGGMKKRGWY